MQPGTRPTRSTRTRYKAGDEPVQGYRLTEFIGEGGIGEVWKAVFAGGTEKAIKIIPLRNRQGLKEFQAIRFFRKLNHPNLIDIIAFWLKDDRGGLLDSNNNASETTLLAGKASELIIAMGLGEKSLADRLKECKAEGLQGIPPLELMIYMEDAASALDYLNDPTQHAGTGFPGGIQHCDIKPGNILIVGRRAKVCDFGLARVFGQEAATAANAASPYYVAPEFIAGHPSQWTDQYSLAITYVELRTGKLPFEAKNAYELLAIHSQGQLDLSRLPIGEQRVIKRATALDPEKRWPTTTDMVRELRRCLEGGGGEGVTGRGVSRSVSKAGVHPDTLLTADSDIGFGYKLKRLLGRGGYGEVWEGRAPGGRPCALKIVRNLEAKEGRQEFRALEIMKNITHAHLMEIQAYWLLDDQSNVIDEELLNTPEQPPASMLVVATMKAEKNLMQRLKDYQKINPQPGTGIPLIELLRYTREAAEAIDYMNEQDIQHRDIKPENLLLTRDNHVKVSDFGLAKVVEGGASIIHEASVGFTYYYAAAEVFRNQVTRWSDQYSLAVTYYKLRTGELPFDKNTPIHTLIMMHMEGRLDFSLVPELEQAVLRRATSVIPKNRYDSCVEMVTALERACAPFIDPNARILPLTSDSSSDSGVRKPSRPSMGSMVNISTRPPVDRPPLQVPPPPPPPPPKIPGIGTGAHGTADLNKLKQLGLSDAAADTYSGPLPGMNTPPPTPGISPAAAQPPLAAGSPPLSLGGGGMRGQPPLGRPIPSRPVLSTPNYGPDDSLPPGILEPSQFANLPASTEVPVYPAPGTNTAALPSGYPTDTLHPTPASVGTTPVSDRGWQHPQVPVGLMPPGAPTYGTAPLRSNSNSLLAGVLVFVSAAALVVAMLLLLTPPSIEGDHFSNNGIAAQLVVDKSLVADTPATNVVPKPVEADPQTLQALTKLVEEKKFEEALRFLKQHRAKLADKAFAEENQLFLKWSEHVRRPGISEADRADEMQVYLTESRGRNRTDAEVEKEFRALDFRLKFAEAKSYIAGTAQPLAAEVERRISELRDLTSSMNEKRDLDALELLGRLKTVPANEVTPLAQTLANQASELSRSEFFSKITQVLSDRKDSISDVDRSKLAADLKSALPRVEEKNRQAANALIGSLDVVMTKEQAESRLQELAKEFTPLTQVLAKRDILRARLVSLSKDAAKGNHTQVVRRVAKLTALLDAVEKGAALDTYMSDADFPPLVRDAILEKIQGAEIEKIRTRILSAKTKADLQAAQKVLSTSPLKHPWVQLAKVGVQLELSESLDRATRSRAETELTDLAGKVPMDDQAFDAYRRYLLVLATFSTDSPKASMERLLRCLSDGDTTTWLTDVRKHQCQALICQAMESRSVLADRTSPISTEVFVDTPENLAMLEAWLKLGLNLSIPSPRLRALGGLLAIQKKDAALKQLVQLPTLELETAKQLGPLSIPLLLEMSKAAPLSVELLPLLGEIVVQTDSFTAGRSMTTTRAKMIAENLVQTVVDPGLKLASQVKADAPEPIRLGLAHLWAKKAEVNFEYTEKGWETADVEVTKAIDLVKDSKIEKDFLVEAYVARAGYLYYKDYKGNAAAIARDVQLAKQLDPQHPRAFWIEAYLDEGVADTEFAKAMKLTGAARDQAIQAGRAAQLKALAAYESALANSQNRKNYLSQRNQFLRPLNQLAIRIGTASAIYDRAQRKSILEKMVAINRSLVESNFSEPEKALNSMALAMEDLAWACGEKQRYPEAVATFRRAIAEAGSQDPGKIRMDLGRCLYRWAAYDVPRESRKPFQDALDVLSDAEKRLTRAVEDAKRNNDPITSLSNYLQETQYWIGMTRWAMRDYEEARETLNKVPEKGPFSVQASVALTALVIEQAELALERGETDKVKPLLEEAETLSKKRLVSFWQSYALARILLLKPGTEEERDTFRKTAMEIFKAAEATLEDPKKVPDRVGSEQMQLPLYENVLAMRLLRARRGLISTEPTEVEAALNMLNRIEVSVKQTPWECSPWLLAEVYGTIGLGKKERARTATANADLLQEDAEKALREAVRLTHPQDRDGWLWRYELGELIPDLAKGNRQKLDEGRKLLEEAEKFAPATQTRRLERAFRKYR